MLSLLCGSSNLGPVTRKQLGDIMKPTAFFEDGEAQARDQPFVQILLVGINYTSNFTSHVWHLSECFLLLCVFADDLFFPCSGHC